ncbi:MAG: dicarboxylate/amino acid:cation symporter [Myxococcota bacterium]
MNGSRSLPGIALGGGAFLALILLDRIALGYAALALGLLLFCLRTRTSLNWQIVLGAALGVGIGLALQGLTTAENAARHVAALAVIGGLFIAALKMLIAPMILLSITHGIAQMAEARDLGRIGLRTVALYLLTMVLAVTTGLVLVNLFHPGRGSALLESRFFLEAVGGAGELPAYASLPEFLHETLRQILTNPFASLAEGRVLPIVVFAILLGIALLQLGARATVLVQTVSASYEAIMKMIGWIIRLAPVGIFALIGKLVASVPFGDLVENLGRFAGVVILGILIHAFVTLPLFARVLAGMHPAKLFRGIREALVVAFSTSSSAATLPVTTRCVEENLQVPPSVSSFVLPLGATVNMDGTALYEAIAAVFVAAIYGIDLPLGSQLVVFFVAMVTAIGAPGIPSAGMVTMLVVLEAVNLPGEAVGILLTIDRFLDTFRTMANVEGDAVVAVCVARSEAGGGYIAASTTTGD